MGLAGGRGSATPARARPPAAAARERGDDQPLSPYACDWELMGCAAPMGHMPEAVATGAADGLSAFGGIPPPSAGGGAFAPAVPLDAPLDEGQYQAQLTVGLETESPLGATRVPANGSMSPSDSDRLLKQKRLHPGVLAPRAASQSCSMIGRLGIRFERLSLC